MLKLKSNFLSHFSIFYPIVILSASNVVYNTLYTFEEDSGCDGLAQSLGQQKWRFLDRVNVCSSNDCARTCIRSKDCKYIWMMKIEGEMKCELFSLISNAEALMLKTGNSLAESQLKPGGLCYKYLHSSGNNEYSRIGNENIQQADSDSSSESTTTSLNDNSQNDETSIEPYTTISVDKSSSFENNTELKRNSSFPDIQWIVYIDKDDPTTLDEQHILNRKDTYMMAKVVSLDGFGTWTIADINHISFYSSKWRGGTIYTMERNSDGFIRKDACIVVQMFHGNNGRITTNYLHPNGSSWNSITVAVQMQVLTQNISEFSIHFEPSDSILETDQQIHSLTSMIENGHKIYNYNRVELDYHSHDIYFQRINGKLKLGRGIAYATPLWYYQVTVTFGKKIARMNNKLGVVNTRNFMPILKPNAVAASPQWGSITKDDMILFQRKEAFQRKLFWGQRFRVRVAKEYFDVYNLNIFEDEVYFHLQQMITYDKHAKFDESSLEIRSFVTISGDSRGCFHRLESETGFPFNDTLALSEIELFTDLKQWKAVYSVFSNGTVESGNALWLANELMTGKDANVLVQWTQSETLQAKAMTVQMTTIKDLHKGSILVTSESHPGWYLDDDGQGKLGMTTNCEKEKVLVKSSGKIEILVYNIHSRREVMTNARPLKITWFVN